MLALHNYETEVLREDVFDPSGRHYTEDLFTFAVCIRCDQPLLLQESHTVIEGHSIPQSEMRRVYPPDTSIPEAVPTAVARPYREAHLAYKVKLYDSCATMCRKTLEFVCGHYGESRGSLSKRLDRLRTRGVIDRGMFEWTEELRLSGNKGAHVDADGVTDAEARDLLEFARAVLLYAFELPKRLQRARQRRNS